MVPPDSRERLPLNILSYYAEDASKTEYRTKEQVRLAKISFFIVDLFKNKVNPLPIIKKKP
jgi:hypothetical protein